MDNKKQNKGTVVSSSSGGKSKVWFWAPDCKYQVILNNAKKLMWKLVKDERNESKVNIYWIDVSTIHERFKIIQPWQMINHFPGMPNIARKNRMGQNLNKMLKIYPKEYSFYPRTWVLPGEMADFKQNFDENGNSLGNKIFIIKPDAGCQGRGIFLTTAFKNVPLQENVVAQIYMKKPLLLDGFKFDLRIYVLVASVKPLRLYLFKDGLVRICTEPYSAPSKENISNPMMHLTNYAVNKQSSNFHQPTASSSDDSVGQDDCSKRSLHWFMHFIEENYGKPKVDSLWNKIGKVCVRTLLTVMPTLSREYDFHFKNFKNIPVKAPAPAESSSGSAAATSAVKSAKPKSKTAKSKSRRVVTSEKEGEDDDDDEDDDEEEDNDDDTTATDETSTSPNNLPEYDNIQFRGSRCFEVLGLDIMIDSNLKPWLIEVNHLPSFGTDSPLDLDVKDRLMAQVLPTLAALPDDEAVFIRHQKNEAAKRLVARKTQSENKGAATSTVRSNSKPPIANRRSSNLNSSTSASPTRSAQVGDSMAASTGNETTSDNPDETSEVFPVEGTETDDKLTANNEEEKEWMANKQKEDDMESALRSHLDEDGALRIENLEINTIIEDIHKQEVDSVTNETGNESWRHETNDSANVSNSSIEQDGNKNDGQHESVTAHAPVTHDRLEAIKKELREIYEICSPEKMSKIDRLLQKYLGREEEFLEFVHMKYAVPSVENMSILPSNPESGTSEPSSDSNHDLTKKDDNIKKNPMIPKRPRPAAPSKPILRPPFRGGGGFGSASRFSNFDDNLGATNGARRGNDVSREQLRREILEEHVSSEETDPWMVREAKFLKEFIRIFPSTHSKHTKKDNLSKTDSIAMNRSNVSRTGSEDGEEDDDDDDSDEDEDGTVNRGSATASNVNKDVDGQVGKKKRPTASFEDILCSVFELDRRLLMRFQRPSRERSESADAASSSTTTTSSSSSSAAKESTPVKEEVKPIVISKTQAEMAARLSQGLSSLKDDSRVTSNNYTRAINADRRVYIESLNPGSTPTYDNVEMDPTFQNYRSRVLSNSGMYVIDDFRAVAAPTGLAQMSNTSVQNPYQTEFTYNSMFGLPKTGVDQYKPATSQTIPQQQSAYGMPQRGSARGVVRGKLYSLDHGMTPSLQQPNRSIIQQGSAGVLRQQVFQFDSGSGGGDPNHGASNYHAPAASNSPGFSKNGMSMGALNITGSTVLTAARPALTPAKSPGNPTNAPSNTLNAASNSSNRR